MNLRPNWVRIRVVYLSLIIMKKQDKPFEMIILGPPVSGKGTQADLLAKTLGIPHVSAGQLLHELANTKSNPLSQAVGTYLAAGKLVPNAWINNLVLKRLRRGDCRDGFVLDGYPRSADQIKNLEQAVSLEYVFLIAVSDRSVIERVAGRRVCPRGHTWHIKFNPTKKVGICDICGRKLFQRLDDRPAVARARLKLYHREMDPIIKIYRQKKLLVKINGEAHIEKVFQSIVQHIIYDLRRKKLK